MENQEMGCRKNEVHLKRRRRFGREFAHSEPVKNNPTAIAADLLPVAPSLMTYARIASIPSPIQPKDLEHC